MSTVLIAFVTPSEPGSDRGPASIPTLAKAKSPDFIYLIHTESTADNVEHVEEWIAYDPDLHAETVPILVDLDDDPTDYERLKNTLPRLLAEIYMNHMGAQFHLVSGLVQVRMIFALSLFAAIVPGATIWEVNPPKRLRRNDQRPAPSIPTPQILDAKEAEARLESMDTSLFSYFQKLYEDRHKKARLIFYLDANIITLDGKSLGLRGGNTFRATLLLACKSVYGGGDVYMAKRQIESLVYGKTDRGSQFWNFAKGKNYRIKRDFNLREPSLNPFFKQKANTPVNESYYCLNENLAPYQMHIAFRGDDLASYLKRHFGPSIMKEFPKLH